MIQIKEEFKKLIPALTNEEFKQLEANCLAEGIRDKIITWNGFIIDGHNRYEIATRQKLKFETESKEFESEIDVRIWMRNNQNGRRNLNKAWKTELELGNKEDLALKGEAIRVEKISHFRQEGETLSQNDNIPKHNTQKEIAKAAGVSTGFVAMSEVVKAKSPKLWEKAKDGEITVTTAYQEIKKEEKKAVRIELIEQQIEDIEQGKLPKLKGLYNVVSVDPPWPYEGESKKITSFDSVGRRVANPYPEMSISEIMKIEMPLMDDSVVLLWTTHKFLPDAFEILKEWGMDYKATLVWNKEKIGMGSWFRMQCEFCLVGVKGKPYWENTTFRDILNEPRREHSRKPDIFFSMIETITKGRRLEYFSREKRKGWEVFGNDINKF